MVASLSNQLTQGGPSLSNGPGSPASGGAPGSQGAGGVEAALAVQAVRMESAYSDSSLSVLLKKLKRLWFVCVFAIVCVSRNLVLAAPRVLWRFVHAAVAQGEDA